MTRAVAVLGKARVAAALGVSESRLEQLSNPMRTDWRAADMAAAVDALLIEEGRKPVFMTEFHRRLASSPPGSAILPAPALARAAVDALKRALADLDLAIGGQAAEVAA